MGFSGFTFVNDGTTHQLFNLKSQKMWGWALGLTWLMQLRLGITAEARLADQKALHLTGELAF